MPVVVGFRLQVPVSTYQPSLFQHPLRPSDAHESSRSENATNAVDALQMVGRMCYRRRVAGGLGGESVAKPERNVEEFVPECRAVSIGLNRGG